MITKPKPFREVDWEKVKQAACDYLENLEDKEDGGAYEDNYANDVFETVMKALYGEDVFEYINERINEFECE